MMERLQKQPFQSREEKSRVVLAKITALREYKKAEWLFSYLSMNYEVETIRLIENGRVDGKRIAAPVIMEEGKSSCSERTCTEQSRSSRTTGSFLISEIWDCLKELEIGPFGIAQPKLEFLRPVDPKVLEMAVVPGVAFGKNGHRLGHGKGYFDRFLRQLSPNCLKVGVAFNFQLLPELPNEAHDVPLDVIVTEEQVIISNESK